jgi:hypothetical protein
MGAELSVQMRVSIYVCSKMKIIKIYTILRSRRSKRTKGALGMGKKVPPERIELTTPGLQDLCSATELRRHEDHDIVSNSVCTV